MKVCKACELEKPFEEFHKSRVTKDGREGACKSCKRDRQYARRAADPEAVRAIEKRWRDGNRETKRQAARDWREKNPEAARRIARRSLVTRKYGLTLEAYEELLEAQGGRCAICDGTNGNGNALAVDHDHACCPGERTCGKCIRGLLCHNCNVALGLLHDDPVCVDRVAAYLRVTSSR